MNMEAGDSPESFDRVERMRVFTDQERVLTDEELKLLEAHSQHEVSDLQKRRLKAEVQKNWDIFYKRNGDRFFKDRHWHVHELDWFLDPLRKMRDTSSENKTSADENLCQKSDASACASSLPTKEESTSHSESVTVLEIGCGAGNFLLPLLETCAAEQVINRVRSFACDFSPRAVELLRSNAQANSYSVTAFVADLTAPSFEEQVDSLQLTQSCDLVALVFVLSAISPEKHLTAFRNAARCLKRGGYLLFRDYGALDFAMLKLNARRSRISERSYSRTDGTLSYYFKLEEIRALCDAAGMCYTEPSEQTCQSDSVLRTPSWLTYVQTQTINVKEGVCLPRVFVHGVLRKL